MLRRVLEAVLGGLVIAAVFVLAGCEPAVSSGKPKAVEPSIEGEWTVTEALDKARGGDLADEHDMTLIFTEDSWVWTFDPPLMGVTADSSSIAVFVGSYELLTDTRMLFVFERPVEGELVFEYSLDASTLVFTLAGERWLTATRVRR